MTPCIRLFCFLLLFIYSLVARAATVYIDAGSADDEFFVGGSTTAFAATAGVTDLTIRYGEFRYELPCDDGPYILTFGFIEHFMTQIGQRQFQVRLNDQVLFDKLDVLASAGFLTPMRRPVMAFCVDGKMIVQFIRQKQNATLSSIEYTPLALPLGLALIRNKCARCHGADLIPGDTHLVGGLDLRTTANMLTGGSRGPALALWDPPSSLLYQAVIHPQFPTATAGETVAAGVADDDSLAMPPFAPLKNSQKNAIRDWILAGAPER
jgi:hypothetical protein